MRLIDLSIAAHLRVFRIPMRGYESDEEDAITLPAHVPNPHEGL